MIPFVNEALGISESKARHFNSLPCSMPVGLDKNARGRLWKEGEKAYFSYKLDGERVFVVCDRDGRCTIVNRCWKETPLLFEKANDGVPAETILDGERMKDGTIYIFDVICWASRMERESSFEKRLAVLQELDEMKLLPRPLCLKRWEPIANFTKEHKELPKDSDGIIFVFADAPLHVGRDRNVVKWKPKPTLDFFVNEEGEVMYRYRTSMYYSEHGTYIDVPLKFYGNDVLSKCGIKLVLPHTNTRNVVIECSLKLEGKNGKLLRLETLCERHDKKEANDLSTIDGTITEVLSGNELFCEVVEE